LEKFISKFIREPINKMFGTKKSLKSVSKLVEKKLDILFKLHDINSNGTIEVDELRKITKILENLDENELEERINEDLKKLDKNNDKKITIDEFSAPFLSELEIMSKELSLDESEKIIGELLDSLINQIQEGLKN
jgi:hypothetical protein